MGKLQYLIDMANGVEDEAGQQFLSVEQLHQIVYAITQANQAQLDKIAECLNKEETEVDIEPLVNALKLLASKPNEVKVSVPDIHIPEIKLPEIVIPEAQVIEKKADYTFEVERDSRGFIKTIKARAE